MLIFALFMLAKMFLRYLITVNLFLPQKYAEIRHFLLQNAYL